MTLSVFRPRFEPAASIYDAFQAEAKKRPLRSVEEWRREENAAVLKAATEAAQRFGLTPPTPDMVRSAEIYASGSVDYGSQWAVTLVQSMCPDRVIPNRLLLKEKP
jgi:hypothetical protein